MEEPKAVTPWFLDKGIWVMVLGLLLPILNKKLGIDLKAEEIYGLLAPILVYIVMHKWKSGMLTKVQMLNAANAAGQKAAESPPPPTALDK